MIFKVDKSKKVKYFYRPLLIGLAIDLLVTLVLTLYFNIGFIIALKVLLAILIGQGILFYIPLLIFYLNYFKLDRETTLLIDSEKNIIEYRRGHQKVDFRFDEINNIELFLSIPAYNNGPILLYWHIFHIWRINTSDNSVLVSCLVCDDILHQLPFIDNVHKDKFHIRHAFPKKIKNL